MNTIGKILTLTTFGESHGPAMGGVLDGMPAGVEIDLDELQRFVDRRRTGSYVGASTRDEKDRVEVLSGIWQASAEKRIMQPPRTPRAVIPSPRSADSTTATSGSM